MKAKKVYVILIVALFVIAMLSCCYFMLNVSKIEISFAVNENTDVKEISDKLDEFKGKNMLFLDLEDIKEAGKSFDYFEIIKVKKDYPSTIKIEIKERREVYALYSKDNVYVMSEKGYIFNIYDEETFNQNNTLSLITLKLDGINVLSTKAKENIMTDNPTFMGSVFDMAEKIELTDCVKEIEAVSAVEKKNVIFKTFTGVEIVVYDSDDEGLRKIANQFIKYENLSDYQKAYGYIYITKLEETGEIRATWSDVNSKE